MQKYTNEELKKRLLEDDYPNNEKLLSGVIEKINNFGNEAQSMFDDWYSKTLSPNFDINGITPAFLRKNHSMKDPGIIIAYDWLLKKPEEAVHLLKKGIM
jgi:hypothetical protein